MSLEIFEYGGWRCNARLANAEIELLVTGEVGPRILRFGFIDGRNILGEIPDRPGCGGEAEWRIRGGHRLWIAPEDRRRTYEPDNDPVAVEETGTGVRTIQPPGPASGVSKTMQISLSKDRNEAALVHVLTNRRDRPVALAPWALTVMAKGGTAIIPLPPKVPHSERLTHNQEWSIWGYADFTDDRWTFGSRYVTLRHDPRRGPTKLGIAHREGWVAYLLGDLLFKKRFRRSEGAAYPDGGVNFETFADENILELESLGPLVTLDPGQSAVHEENWSLHRGVPECRSEADFDRIVRPLC